MALMHEDFFTLGGIFALAGFVVEEFYCINNARSNVEIVHQFNYLVILFNFNSKFKDCKELIYSQARKAMFSLLSNFKKFD